MSGRGRKRSRKAVKAQPKLARGDEAIRTPGRSERTNPAALPAILACIFVAALPFPGVVDLPSGVSFALVTMLISIPVWFEAARARNTPFDATATRVIFVILTSAGFLIIWSLLSTFGADSPLRATRYLATLIAAFAVYFLVRGTVTRTRIVLYVDVLAAGLAVTAVISLLAYKFDSLHDIIFRGTDRASGFFKNPNQFGMAISTTMPAVMALLLAERRRRSFRAVCIFLMLLGLVASGSKTNLLLAWASILAVLCGHALIAHSGVRRIWTLVLYLIGSVAFAAIGVLALTLLNPRALVIMTEFFGGEGKIDSLLTRSFLWAYSLDQFLADPFLGQGAGQRIDIFYREADVAHSHNVLIDYMRTLGAPGLLGVAVLISAVVVVCLLSIGRTLRSDSGVPPARLICLGLSLCCLNYVAANMSSDSFGPSTSPFFWLFAYLSLAARSLMPRPHPDTRERLKQPTKPESSIRFPELASQADLNTNLASGGGRLRSDRNGVLSIIPRWALREHLSIREIARRTKFSHNSIRK